jgi:hypothetical protein
VKNLSSALKRLKDKDEDVVEAEAGLEAAKGKVKEAEDAWDRWVACPRQWTSDDEEMWGDDDDDDDDDAPPEAPERDDIKDDDDDDDDDDNGAAEYERVVADILAASIWVFIRL